ALLFELFLEGGGDRYGVEHSVDRNTGEHGLLLERDAELLVGFEELWIDLIERLGRVVLRFRSRVIDDVLVIDLRVVDVGPGGLAHGKPVAVGFQAPFEEPLGFLLFSRDQADDVLAEAAGDGFGLDVRDESPLIFLIRKRFNSVRRIAHQRLLNCWAIFILPNLYFLVKITQGMDASEG